MLSAAASRENTVALLLPASQLTAECVQDQVIRSVSMYPLVLGADLSHVRDRRWTAGQRIVQQGHLFWKQDHQIRTEAAESALILVKEGAAGVEQTVDGSRHGRVFHVSDLVPGVSDRFHSQCSGRDEGLANGSRPAVLSDVSSG